MATSVNVHNIHEPTHLTLLIFMQAYQKMRKLLIICLLLFTTSANTSFDQHVFYVKPTADSPCPHPASNCQVLQYYFTEVHSHGIDYLLDLPLSDTTLYFLPGTHAVDLPGTVLQLGVYNITLSGIETSPNSSSYTLNATVHCISRTAFLFASIPLLTIAQLTFVNCGTDLFNASVDEPQIGGALAFLMVTDLTVSEVVVKNSTGYGLFCLNVLGDVVIAKSEFVDNSDNWQIEGGNAFVFYSLTEQECLTTSSKSATFSIQSSLIINGNTNPNSNNSYAGLYIALDHSYINITIDISNTTISGNGKYSQEGRGNLLMVIAEPHNSVGTNHILIQNSHITDGVASHPAAAGGMTVIIGNDDTLDVDLNTTAAPWGQATLVNSLKVLDSEISLNSHTHPYGNGGVVVTIHYVCQKYITEFSGVAFVNNMAIAGPAGVGNMQYRLQSVYAGTLSPVHFLSMKDCTVMSGKGFLSGGLHVQLDIYSLLRAQISGNDFPKIHWGEISNSTFINNSGFYNGAVTLRMGNKHTLQLEGYRIAHLMQMKNCTLMNNSAGLGSAIVVFGDSSSPIIEQLPFSLVFDQVLFSANNIAPSNTLFGDSVEYLFNYSYVFVWYHASNAILDNAAAVLLANSVVTTLHNCHFQDNNSSALGGANMAYIILEGNVTFSRNRARRGAGIFLYATYVSLKPNTHVYFEDNYAEEVGGAMFIHPQQEVFLKDYHCSFYPMLPVDFHLDNANIKIQMVNNTAGIAGSAIYGGYIDSCDSSYIRTVFDADENSPLWDYSPSLVYNLILNYTSETGLSVISSDPVGVCYCDECSTSPNCVQKAKSLESFPGQTFNVSVVAVGQRDGVVPSTVYAIFKDTNTPHSYSLGELQASQYSGTGCTNLTFNVHSSTIAIIQMFLTVENPATPKQLYERSLSLRPSLLSIILSPCPLGFNISGTPPKCRCVSQLKEHGITCDIDTQRITRPAGVWIGYY